MNIKLYGFFTVCAGVFLFGGLIATGVTNDGLYFLIGYPLALISLVLAYGANKL